MSDLRLQLRDYRLTTAEIIYYLPDHPDLLQSFVWQHLDLPPDYPNLRRFLDFWAHNLDGRLHSIKIGRAGPLRRTRFRHVVASQTLH